MYLVLLLVKNMNNFKNWFYETCSFDKATQDEIVEFVLNSFNSSHENINEVSEISRYSVEVNHRTKKDDVLNGFAKIALGYISAALKKHGYHTKHVFEHKPLRLLVTSRNWDDGTWVGAVTWNDTSKCFVISKGHYNKMRKSVLIQSTEKCDGDSAVEVAKQLHNVMHGLKGKPDKHQEKLKPVPLKRGPKN